MLFNSLIFLCFLPIVFALYWCIPPRWRNIFLLLASYYFYFSYNPWFLLLLIGTSAFDYWCARRIQRQQSPRAKKTFLLLSVISNIGVLFAFKYAVFFYNGFAFITSSIFHFPSYIVNIIIPAGLSFYTFQSLSYTIDVYRGKYAASDTLSDFLLYVSFFPHMVAGPIVRYNDLMPQFKVVQYFRQIDWGGFARLVIWGYFKKMVIADNLAKIINPMFDQPAGYSSAELWLAGFLFVVQLYCDFSGYSDIAIGVAKLFHINLSINWRRPLLASSFTQYWHRHHISLTNWFREYVYISLGGNRVSYGRWLFNILFVFLISGLWHGASVTFLVWALLHGLFYLGEQVFNKKYPGFKGSRFIGWMYVTLFNSLFFIAFRANSMAELGQIYSTILHFKGGFGKMWLTNDHSFLAVMACMIVLLYVKELNEEFGLWQGKAGYRATWKPAFYIAMLCLIFCFGNFHANAFIYFQF